MDRRQRARTFLGQVMELGALEGMPTVEVPAMEALPTIRLAQPGLEHPDQLMDVTRSAAQKVLSDQDLTPPEQFALEAIIIPGQRPAIDIVNGDFTVTTTQFAEFSTNADLKGNIVSSLPSIGRIEVSGFPGLPYGGTGFVVGKDLLMTNRHVAELFTTGLGSQSLDFRPGMGAGVDFRQERGHTESQTLTVRRVVMIHPFWDMALLQTEELLQHEPLRLSLQPPEAYANEEVAVIGYPAFDPRNPTDVQNTVFGGVYNVKRLLPGKAGLRRAVSSFGHNVSAVTHDASTLGGNSGSAVLHPKSGTVLGLHFAGVYLDANFFVPVWELSRDDRVVKAGANFGPGVATPDPAQTSTWWASVESAAPTPTPTPAPQGTPTAVSVVGSGTLNVSASTSVVTLTIPLEITVQLGSPSVAEPG